MKNLLLSLALVAVSPVSAISMPTVPAFFTEMPGLGKSGFVKACGLTKAAVLSPITLTKAGYSFGKNGLKSVWANKRRIAQVAVIAGLAYAANKLGSKYVLNRFKATKGADFLVSPVVFAGKSVRSCVASGAERLADLICPQFGAF